jgi:hypothetical protein
MLLIRGQDTLSLNSVQNEISERVSCPQFIYITLREGQLYYQREGRPEYRLIPLNKNTFALEGYAPFRIRFASDESGQVTKIVGLYIQGNTDQSPRDKN